GLLLGTRHLVVRGAELDSLRGARRLLIFSSCVTLALNVADPLVRGQFGKAAFDAVGPLLLIGWSEVGPSLLHALSASTSAIPPQVDSPEATEAQAAAPVPDEDWSDAGTTDTVRGIEAASHLLDRAREED